MLIAGALSGIAGYAYGIHSVRDGQRGSGTLEQKIAAASAAPALQGAGDDVLAPPPSWMRWPQTTDF